MAPVSQPARQPARGEPGWLRQHWKWKSMHCTLFSTQANTHTHTHRARTQTTAAPSSSSFGRARPPNLSPPPSPESQLKIQHAQAGLQWGKIIFCSTENVCVCVWLRHCELVRRHRQPARTSQTAQPASQPASRLGGSDRRHQITLAKHCCILCVRMDRCVLLQFGSSSLHCSAM